jgi:iron complex transport system ATP-binding protein
MNILDLNDATVPGRLGNVTLGLPRGKLVGLVGPNGAGKSTLLRVAAGLLPAGGTVAWNGRPLSGISALERARCAAWVPQEAHFEFGFSVRSVVSQGRYAHGDDGKGVDEALARFGLSTLAGRPVNHLSGGERARVLLARAFVTEAPLQLWDEPLAPLDPRHRLEVLVLARELARNGSTVFLSLHDLSLASSLDLLAVLCATHLRALGSPDEILTPALLLDVFGVRASQAPGLNFELP